MAQSKVFIGAWQRKKYIGAWQEQAAAVSEEIVPYPIYFFTQSYTYKFDAVASVLVGTPQSGHPAADAVDYDKSTYCEIAHANPEMKFDLGAAYEIDSIWFKSDNIATYTVYHSDNGTSWTQADDTTTGNADGINYSFAFTAATKRYWRILVNSKTAGGSNVKFYEVMLMKQRLVLNTLPAMPARVEMPSHDRIGGAYQLGDGQMTSFAGDRIFDDIEMTFDRLDITARGNLYTLFSTPVIRPLLTIWADWENYPEKMLRVIWGDKSFPLVYQDGWRGAGFAGRLLFEEY